MPIDCSNFQDHLAVCWKANELAKRILCWSCGLCSLTTKSITNKKCMRKETTISMDSKRAWHLTLESFHKCSPCSYHTWENSKTLLQEWEIYLCRLWSKFKRLQVVLAQTTTKSYLFEMWSSMKKDNKILGLIWKNTTSHQHQLILTTLSVEGMRAGSKHNRHTWSFCFMIIYPI